ncbi:MAG: hypothetical protein AAFR58_20310 [Cyanobacteria bacterium J06627_28]
MQFLVVIGLVLLTGVAHWCCSLVLLTGVAHFAISFGSSIKFASAWRRLTKHCSLDAPSVGDSDTITDVYSLRFLLFYSPHPTFL